MTWHLSESHTYDLTFNVTQTPICLFAVLSKIWRWIGSCWTYPGITCQVICVIWGIRVLTGPRAAHLYLCRHSLIFAYAVTYTFVLTILYTWSSNGESWSYVWLECDLMHSCVRGTRMTHSYLCCDSCIYAFAVTHSFLSALSHIWAFKKSSHTCDLTHSCATGLRVTYLYLRCDSCIYACAVTHSYNWFYWLLSPETAI